MLVYSVLGWMKTNNPISCPRQIFVIIAEMTQCAHVDAGAVWNATSLFACWHEKEKLCIAANGVTIEKIDMQITSLWLLRLAVVQLWFGSRSALVLFLFCSSKTFLYT